MAAVGSSIDWRQEFDALAPYVQGSQGGVVLVRYDGERCGPTFFVEALTALFEAGPSNERRASVRLDRDVYSTRYLADMRSEILRKIGANDPPRRLPIGPLFSNNHAGGKMELHAHITITPDEHELVADRNDWVSHLGGSVETYLRGGRLMVVVMDGHPTDQDQIWRHVWNGALAALVPQGLLLVHMLDTVSHSRHSSAPQPDLELLLPKALDIGRQSEARTDVATIFRTAVPAIPSDTAKWAANALVQACRDDVSRLHAETSAMLLQMSQEWGDD